MEGPPLSENAIQSQAADWNTFVSIAYLTPAAFAGMILGESESKGE